MFEGQPVVVTAPTEEPVTLSEAKLHCRVDGSDDDALLSSLIAAARAACEVLARRAFVTRTLDYRLASWPAGRSIVLPLPPLVSVTSIAYTDEDGVAGTVPSTDYVVYSQVEPGLIVLKPVASWPAATLMPGPALVVRYVAGFGAAAAVPAEYKHAIKLTVGHWYENREAVVVGAMVAKLPLAVKDLLTQDRVSWV